jgi:hypothetical protein
MPTLIAFECNAVEVRHLLAAHMRQHGWLSSLSHFAALSADIEAGAALGRGSEPLDALTHDNAA